MQYGLVVVWLAAYLALGLAALPLAGALFPRLAGRGAAFAVPLALAVVGVVGYAVGHLAFGWPALLAGVGVLVGASFLAGREAEVDRRAYAEAAAVFAVAFLFLVAVRAVDPAVHPAGGEKFLDFGLLKSLSRTGRLPPEDMWFAGEPVQYYYGGHLLAALLSWLTVTPPKFAYNLALPGFFAAFVTAAYGLAGSVAADHGAPRRVAGVLGAFLAGFASNLLTPARTLLWVLPDGLARPVGTALGLSAEEIGWTPAGFFYWDASRIIDGTINEFPLFAYLNGDLHAHMTSTAFMLLLAGLLYSYWRTPETDRGFRRLLVFGAVPPVAGLIALVNTWSFPTTAGLTLLVLAFAPARPTTLLPDAVFERLPAGVAGGAVGARERPDGGVAVRFSLREELLRDGTALAVAVGVTAVAAVWVLPFWFGTASSRPVGFLPDRSGLGPFLLVHGAFLAAFVPYLARRGLTAAGDPLAVGVVAVLAGAVAWQLGFAAVGVLGPLLAAAWLLLRLRRDVGFETVLMVAGMGLVLLVEFVFVVEDAAPGRMNTVFKTYAQVWVLWAPAAAVALTRLATASPDVPTPGLSPEAWRTAGTALAVVLVFSTALYAGFAVPNHFDRGGRVADAGDPTLDATAFLANHPDEAPAIRWVDSLEGQPNIVTAAPGGYRWNPAQGKGASAASSLTGVPTVAGWFHEIGYRGNEPFQERVRDVRTIYTGRPAEQAALLRQYDVEYVYVGPAERGRYGDITVGGLRGVQRHERLGDVTIYRVDQERLPG